MHRAAFAEKACAEALQDALGLNQRAPEASRRVGIVGAHGIVFVEWRRVGQLVRQPIDFYRDTEGVQRVAEFGIKRCDASRCERDSGARAVCRAQPDAVETKSNSMSKEKSPCGISAVINPRAETVNVTCQE